MGLNISMYVQIAPIYQYYYFPLHSTNACLTEPCPLPTQTSISLFLTIINVCKYHAPLYVSYSPWTLPHETVGGLNEVIAEASRPTASEVRGASHLDLNASNPPFSPPAFRYLSRSPLMRGLSLWCTLYSSHTITLLHSTDDSRSDTGVISMLCINVRW